MYLIGKRCLPKTRTIAKKFLKLNYQSFHKTLIMKQYDLYYEYIGTKTLRYHSNTCYINIKYTFFSNR